MKTTPSLKFWIECTFGRLSATRRAEYEIRRPTAEAAALEARRLFAAELNLAPGQARWIRVAF